MVFVKFSMNMSACFTVRMRVRVRVGVTEYVPCTFTFTMVSSICHGMDSDEATKEVVFQLKSEKSQL